MESWWWLAGSDIGCSVDLERGPSAKLVRPRQCRRHYQGARASQGREGAVGLTMAGLVVSADRWDWTLKNRAGPGLVFSVDGPEPGKKRSITLLAWETGPGPVSDFIFGPAVGVPSSAQPFTVPTTPPFRTDRFPGS